MISRQRGSGRRAPSTQAPPFARLPQGRLGRGTFLAWVRLALCTALAAAASILALGVPTASAGAAEHATSSTLGYRLVASDGGIFGYDAAFFGSAGGRHLNEPIVGMAPTPSGDGYWEVASDGGIFNYGDAKFLGSTGA
ncbi:MAG: hypothetical protein WAL61_01185, partial [Acidimicrobiales bacterium]